LVIWHSNLQGELPYLWRYSSWWQSAMPRTHGKVKGYQGCAGPLYLACLQSHVQSVWVYHDQAYPGIILWPDYAGFPRPELKYWAWMHVLPVDRCSPTGQKQEPFSSHILTGLESIFPNQPKDHTVILITYISRRSRITKTSKIRQAVQLTSLLRFGSIDQILDQT